jgi:CPA1 family monovalent cation:H+ antiporter
LSSLTASATDGQTEAVDWRNVLIVAWTGTRGVISLATALALPISLPTGQLFPQRSLILFLSFVVILVTLVLQGMSLPLLIRLLGVQPDNERAGADQSLELLLASRVLNYLNDEFPVDLSSASKQLILRRYQILVHELSTTLYTSGDGATLVEDRVLLTELRLAERTIGTYQQALLVALASKKQFSDEVLRTAERRIDLDMARLDASEQASGN